MKLGVLVLLFPFVAFLDNCIISCDLSYSQGSVASLITIEFPTPQPLSQKQTNPYFSYQAAVAIYSQFLSSEVPGEKIKILGG